MWTITCPACAKILRHPQECAHRPFQCPACGAIFDTPETFPGLRGFSKTAADECIQRAGASDEPELVTEIRPGPPPAESPKARLITTKDIAFAAGFAAAFVLSMLVDPFVSMMLGIGATLFLLFRFIARSINKLANDPNDIPHGNTVSALAPEGSDQIQNP